MLNISVVIVVVLDGVVDGVGVGAFVVVLGVGAFVVHFDRFTAGRKLILNFLFYFFILKID